MIRTVPTSCKRRLEPRDFEFIAKTLSNGASQETECLMQLAADPESLDCLLNHPKLLQAIIGLESPVNITPQLYFYVLVRHVLRESGLNHAGVCDYVSATLADFASGEGPLRPKRGEPLSEAPYHIDFIEELNVANTYDKFYLHVRCANQFMVLTGLFPRFLEHREERRGAPGVRYYEGVARDSFRSARNHPLANEFALAEVYDLLCNEFTRTRMALNRMAREFLWLGA